MTRDDIIRMAREANILEPIDLLESNQWRQDTIRELERFAALVAAAERDRICKQIAQLHDALSMASSSNQIRPKHATIAEWWADRKRKPLTSEKIKELLDIETEALPSYRSAVEELPERFARAVERAHEIGVNK